MLYKIMMKKLFTKFDFLIIVSVLTVAVLLLLFKPKTAGNTAVIRVDGKVYDTVDLNKQDKREISVNGVKIICENGEVYISESPCHDKICIKTGRISKKGQSAVCAPERVSVEIAGKEKNKPLAVTG